MTASAQLSLADRVNALASAITVTNCTSCRDNIRALARKWISESGVQCWCGGEVGFRVPGDQAQLGCLENVMHNWRAAP